MVAPILLHTWLRALAMQVIQIQAPLILKTCLTLGTYISSYMWLSSCMSKDTNHNKVFHSELEASFSGRHLELVSKHEHFNRWLKIGLFKPQAC